MSPLVLTFSLINKLLYIIFFMDKKETFLTSPLAFNANQLFIKLNAHIVNLRSFPLVYQIVIFH